MTSNKSAEVRVGVVDDHPLIRKAVFYSLEREPDMVLTAVCKNRDEIIPYLNAGEVDLLVLDYLLGGNNMDGLQLVKHLRLHYPKVKILMYSAVESPAVVQLVMKAGVKGFIGKSKEQEELIKAIRHVAQGNRFLTSDMQFELDKFSVSEKSMLPFMVPRAEGDDVEVLTRNLSPREVEVIRCYLDGMSISEIAIKYNRSRKTISGQKQSALRKLGMKTDVELFKFQGTIEG